MERPLDPIPFYDPPLDGDAKLLSKGWFRWLDAFVRRVAAGAHLIGSVSLTGQAASISPTDLGVTKGGLYLVSWVVRITQAASTSSSLQVSVNALDDGIAVTQTGPAVTGNTITTVASGQFTVKSDVSSPVTVSTTYASVGATAMAYKIDVQCLRVI